MDKGSAFNRDPKKLSFDSWLKKEGRLEEYEEAGPSESHEIEHDYEDYLERG